MSAPVQGFENTSSAHGAELGAIPFNKIIGGPLTAVIHAQVQSAMATVDFVKKIGFKPPEKSQEEKYSKKQKDSEQANFIGNPVTITFEYEKTAATGMPMPVRLKIPFLTMLPIPTLRVDEVYIDFLAKINSVSSVQLVDDLTVNATTTQIKAGNHEAAQQGDDPYTWTAAMTGTLQQQRQSKTGASITRDYSLGVKVKCVQDELPAGLGKLLDILESAIQEQNKQAAQHNSLLLKPQSVGGKAA